VIFTGLASVAAAHEGFPHPSACYAAIYVVSNLDTCTGCHSVLLAGVACRDAISEQHARETGQALERLSLRRAFLCSRNKFGPRQVSSLNTSGH